MSLGVLDVHCWDLLRGLGSLANRPEVVSVHFG
jgi:hypothetical protein